MRIRFLSDLHLEHQAPPSGHPPAGAEAADVVVLAGDVGQGTAPLTWARRAFPDVPVVFVAGNHEFYDRALDATLPALEAASDPIPSSARKTPNPTGTFFLHRSAIRIGEVRFLGCTFWTGFNLFPGQRARAMKLCRTEMEDYQRIHLLRARRRLRPRDTDRYHRSAVAWLRRQLNQEGNQPSARATVVVTHHPPSPRSMDPRYEDDLTSAAFVARREPLVRKTDADLWIHGHVHAAFDYRIGSTRIVANPRGYPHENLDVQEHRTVEV